ncbi:class I SAM-dependent methyltransferase, partial [Vibrio neptunius]|uniref:class I SAM-dependent methyltransferase n=1 Tax=Vibrio neptunius TaxID=170651 RepID=UPI0005FA6ACD
MSIYDSQQGVQNYVEMCEDYDGKELYEVLRRHVNTESHILELGAGSGHDAAYLSNYYHYLGSDYSDAFLVHLNDKLPHLSFIKLDAKVIKLAKNVDCIYSNKVLHHLTVCELAESLKSQRNSLNSRGYIAHSFWLGTGAEVMDGLTMQYHKKEELLELISANFNVVEAHVYEEFEAGDSIFVIAQKVT